MPDTNSNPAAAEITETRHDSLPVNEESLRAKVKKRKPDYGAIEALVAASHPAARDVSPQEEPLFDALHHAATAILAGREKK